MSMAMPERVMISCSNMVRGMCVRVKRSTHMHADAQFMK